MRTGISWQQVPQIAARRGAVGEQAAVLTELLAAYRAASRQTYFGSETHLPLAAFGSSLWTLLDQAARPGWRSCPDRGSPVQVCSEPVRVVADVHAPEGEAAHVALGVRLGGDWFSAADLDLLGQPNWSRSGPPPTPRRRAVRCPGVGADPGTAGLGGGTPGAPAAHLRQVLVVPAADRDDLVADYLPRLHRRAGDLLRRVGGAARAGGAAARADRGVGLGRGGADRLVVALRVR